MPSDDREIHNPCLAPNKWRTIAKVDRDAIAEFLTRRRQTLLPADVGLPAGPRRRTTGLRREEVALLAAMSVDYYTRLEQRRAPQPSPQILSSLARALRLCPDERDYLYRVAGQNAPDRPKGADDVSPALLRVLDRLDTPATIFSSLAEVLAQNDLARALFGHRTDHEGLDRSKIYRWFAYPDTDRQMYLEHDRDQQSRALVASLRAAYATMGASSRAGVLVDELRRRSPEFTELWKRHDVQQRIADHKILIHPQVGRIHLDCQTLFSEDQSQTLVILTAAPHSEDARKLAALSVLATQQVSNTL